MKGAIIALLILLTNSGSILAKNDDIQEYQRSTSKQTTASTTIQTLSVKEKADILLALAKSAQDQYNQLSETTWRLRISMWTAFTAGIAFLLSLKWKPRFHECLLAICLIVGMLFTVIFVWGPNAYDRMSRYSRVAYYYESAVESLIGAELPKALQPKTAGFIRFPETEGSKKPAWYQSRLHVAADSITCLFALILIGVLVSKLTIPRTKT